MFSTTTIESSITRPMATVTAPSVIMFNVMSSQYKIKNAVNIETGMEMMEMIVDRIFAKKRRMMSTAMIPPNKAFSNIEIGRASCREREEKAQRSSERQR